MLYCTSWLSGSEQFSLRSTQTAVIFGDRDISKSSYNLFLVVEQTNRISLAIYNVSHVINCAVLVHGVVFKKLRDQMTSIKCLYNLFLAVERTHRNILAGFSNLQCVVYVTFLKYILHM